MKTKFYFIQFFLTLVIVLVSGVITVHAQALKVTPNADAGANLDVTAQTRFYYTGNTDGFHIRTGNTSAPLPSQDNDLLWLCFSQAQPNNPGIFGITSMSAAIGWTSCFQVRANGNVGIFNEYPSAALEIGSSGSIRQVKVNGNIVWGSDARMKENIRDISNSLGKLSLLRSVSYNFKEDDRKRSIPDKLLKDGLDIEKINAELKSVPKTNQYLLDRSFYGFLAQDVQKLFPDLVYTDSAGMMSVDYIGLIPLIVESIKEQQKIIDAQSERIAELEKGLETLPDNSILRSSTYESGVTDIFNPVIAQCKLYQNLPNPFKDRTEIRYFLPQEANSAEIYIFNMQGNLLSKIPATHSGLVEINGSHFHAGMYLYSLVVDGQIVDTKRMILTK